MGFQPEWPGQCSAKFTDKNTGRPVGRRIIETNIRNGDSTGLARQGFGAYSTDTRGLESSESKKILPCPGSEVFEWRPCRSRILQPGHDHYEKPEGRRKGEAPPGKMIALCEKRHLRQVESKEEHGDRPVGPKVVHRENGYRAADQPAREVDISYEMQRKVPQYNLLQQRNGIGCKVAGDKAYKHPEYSDRFFKVGNLVVGSGFARGDYKRTEPRNSTSLHVVKVVKRDGPVKSYEEKQAEMFMDEARMEVEELTLKWEGDILRTSDAKYDFVDSESKAFAEGTRVRTREACEGSFARKQIPVEKNKCGTVEKFSGDDVLIQFDGMDGKVWVDQLHNLELEEAPDGT